MLALVVVLLASRPGHALDRFSIVGLDGGSLSQEELESGDTLMVVWASWSPRCYDIRQRLRALERRWQDETQLVSVVFQEDPESIRQFLGLGDGSPAEHGLPPIYIDTKGELSRQLDIATLPSLLVIRQGELVFRGKLPPSPDTEIARLLAEPLP